MKSKDLNEILQAIDVVSVGVRKLAELRADRQVTELIRQTAEKTACKLAACGYSDQEQIPLHTESLAHSHLRALEGLSSVLDLVGGTQAKEASAPTALGTVAHDRSDGSGGNRSSTSKAYRPVRC